MKYRGGFRKVVSTLGGHFVVVVVLILGRKVSHYEDAIGIFLSVPS